jgi:two-component system phosphate regulon sensor histidine kinase PhoR
LTAAEKAKFIDNLYERSQQLGQIIRDILQASEFDTEKISFADKHLTKVDVSVLIDKIKNDFLPEATKKGLVLTINNEASQTIVKTFADYLPEAIGNLVDNAIRYTKTGSIKINLKNVGRDLVIEIADTGVGIPAGDQPRLFSRFARATNARVEYSEGSGLGLFITKEIIEAHKGAALSFVSQEGKGSTFTIKIPTSK